MGMLENLAVALRQRDEEVVHLVRDLMFSCSNSPEEFRKLCAATDKRLRNVIELPFLDWEEQAREWNRMWWGSAVPVDPDKEAERFWNMYRASIEPDGSFEAGCGDGR